MNVADAIRSEVKGLLAPPSNAMVRRAPEERGLLRGPYKTVVSYLNSTIMSTHDAHVDSNNALELTSVWAAIRILAESIGTIPVLPYRTDDDGHLVEDRDHPLYELLTVSPGIYTSQAWMEAGMIDINLEGNTFSFIELRSDGKPREFVKFEPTDVEDAFLFEESGSRRKVIYKTAFGNIPSDRLIHVQAMAKNGIWGMNPIEAHRVTLGTEKASRSGSLQYYRNGAAPSGIVSFPMTLGPDTIDSVRSDLKQLYAGDNRGSIMVLDGGATFNRISLSHVDAEYAKTQENIQKWVAAIYRIPLHMISSEVDKPSYNSMEQLGLEFRRFTVDPWVTRWEQELTRKCYSRREIAAGKCVKFDFTNWQLADLEALGGWLKSNWVTGGYTSNDIRKKFLRLPAVDGGDEPFVQGNNMIPLKDAAKGLSPFMQKKGVSPQSENDNTNE